jgi:hypothetical protein
MLISHPEIRDVSDGLKNKEVNFLIEVILDFDWFNNKFDFGSYIAGDFSTLYCPEFSYQTNDN